MKGREGTDGQYVSSFKLEMSDDGYNNNWKEYVTNNLGNVIYANTDSNNLIHIELLPFKAKYIRIAPVDYVKLAAMRYEVWVSESKAF